MQLDTIDSESNQVLVITNKKSEYLVRHIISALEKFLPGIVQLQVDRRKFADGENYIRLMIKEPLQLFGKDVIVVMTLVEDEEYMEFFRICQTLADLGTRLRMYIIPYLGGAVMNERLEGGNILQIKANAQMFSALSTHGLGNSFLFMDLHSQEFLNYLEGSSQHVEIQAFDILIEKMKQQPNFLQEDYIFASADLGRPKVVERLARFFGKNVALVRKQEDRKSVDGNDNYFQPVIGNVKGLHVIIYDDMIRSGKTIIEAAQALIECGALSVKVVVSHLCCSEDVLQLLQDNQYITSIIATNTHPASQNKIVHQANTKFIIVDVSSEFARAAYYILVPNIRPAAHEVISTLQQIAKSHPEQNNPKIKTIREILKQFVDIEVNTFEEDDQQKTSIEKQLMRMVPYVQSKRHNLQFKSTYQSASPQMQSSPAPSYGTSPPPGIIFSPSSLAQTPQPKQSVTPTINDSSIAVISSTTTP
ncbi:MAG: ribose-phosphate diphosphokinase [Streblomastix strix]|uniref:ribose-phosphate diphosphokinase n=1 Tax=Streblomastix strix TaxID=222440 RepID=A0A5J4WJ59_9EUKA|nr:MAG: ribose-phosphate diphosphokinase [Streblomastix strix]